MDAPADRARDRFCFSGAAAVVPLARLDWSGVARATVVHLRAWGFARRGRLVDGGLGPCRPHRGFTISACDAPRARLRDLCCDHLDRTAVGRAASHAVTAADTPGRDG